jgi:hypothetical protein
MSFSTVRRLKGIQKVPRKWRKKKTKRESIFLSTISTLVLAKTLMQICHMHDQRGI